MTLWPVLLESFVQEDSVRLFELDEVVTLPVVLIDVADTEGWPADLGVQTSITRSEQGGWVTTADGFSCRTRLTGPVGQSGAICAALQVPMMTVGPFSFVTGTVRRIDLVSVVRPEITDPSEPVTSSERWTLTETPVAPVSFRHSRDRRDISDPGMIVQLELLMPRCRCRDLRELMDPEGLKYARRHLRHVADDVEAGTAHYVCRDTGSIWLWHRWKRKRAMEHVDLKPWEPMLLTQQRPGPDLATSQPLPAVSELEQLPLGAVTGSHRDVAQLCAEGKADLERAGIRLTPAKADTPDPVCAAAVQLRNGLQFILVEHLAHPERYVDVRAQTSAPSSKLAARQLLAAAGVPDAHVLWMLEHWWA